MDKPCLEKRPLEIKLKSLESLGFLRILILAVINSHFPFHL